jgi:beta-catenin-like protein 1
VTQNMQYAAEVLAILLHASSKNQKKYVGLNGVDILLQLLGVYWKHDLEKDSDEEYYVENLFDCLTCVIADEGEDKFLEGEGIELAQS